MMVCRYCCYQFPRWKSKPGSRSSTPAIVELSSSWEPRSETSGWRAGVCSNRKSILEEDLDDRPLQICCFVPLREALLGNLSSWLL